MILLKNKFIFFLVCTLMMGCVNVEKSGNTITKKIRIENKGECFYFNGIDTLKFERKIKVLKNTLTDTIVFGLGILKPGYTGMIEYNKLKNRNDIYLDLKYENPPTDRICINLYNQKSSTGVLVLELIKFSRK